MEKARLKNEGTPGNKGVGNNTELKKNNQTRRTHSGSTQGLGTGLKRMSTANSALTASPQVKVFLDEVAERHN
jgi:hypothetical protein